MGRLRQYPREDGLVTNVTDNEFNCVFRGADEAADARHRLG